MDKLIVDHDAGCYLLQFVPKGELIDVSYDAGKAVFSIALEKTSLTALIASMERNVRFCSSQQYPKGHKNAVSIVSFYIDELLVRGSRGDKNKGECSGG